mgnify:CR=1 FL=1
MASLVVCCVGLVGSGKSTVAREFSKLLDAVFISGDDIRVELRKKGESFATVREIALTAALEAVKAGKNAVLDSDFSDFKKREEFTRKFEEVGVRVLFVHVTCDLDVAIGRVIATEYPDGADNFFAGASSLWRGSSQSRGAVVRIREMMRRIPHHYDWSGEMGGMWKPKLLPGPFFAEIDTTHDGWNDRVKECASQLLRT